MPQSSKLLAWIEPRNDDAYLAAFVGKPVATTRRPATQLCLNYVNAARRLSAANNQPGAGQVLERVAEQADRARQIIQRLRDLVRKGETERQIESLPKTIAEASASP